MESHLHCRDDDREAAAVSRFADRASAGSALAAALTAYGNRDDVLVLGLPRGGVPVAAAIAETLGAPLDVMLVRKLGAPEQPELAIGAIAAGGVIVVNENILSAAAGAAEVQAEIVRQRAELNRRESLYRKAACRWPSPAGSSFSSTMAQPPARPCSRRFAPCANRKRDAS